MAEVGRYRTAGRHFWEFLREQGGRVFVDKAMNVASGMVEDVGHETRQRTVEKITGPNRAVFLAFLQGMKDNDAKENLLKFHAELDAKEDNKPVTPLKENRFVATLALFREAMEAKGYTNEEIEAQFAELAFVASEEGENAFWHRLSIIEQSTLGQYLQEGMSRFRAWRKEWKDEVSEELVAARDAAAVSARNLYEVTQERQAHSMNFCYYWYVYPKRLLSYLQLSRLRQWGQANRPEGE